MASPQIENGYTKIANELLEEFVYRDFPGREIRLLLFVIRRTYGFSRTEAPISLSEFSAVMGKNPQDIVRLIQNLENQNVLKVVRFGTTKSNIYSLNKDYETWKNRDEALANKLRAISVGATSVEANSKVASSVGAISTTSVGASSATSVDANSDGIINSYEPQPEQAATFDFLPKKSFKENKRNTLVNFDEIKKLFAEILSELPQPRIFTKIEKNFHARWNQAKEFQSLDFWREYFKTIQASDFLMGRKGDFKASFDWILLPSNFEKILNKNYQNKTNAQCEYQIPKVVY